MNKKGGVIGFAFFIIAFIFLWIIFLAEYVNIIGTLAIESMEATGLMAFILSNINLGILIGLIILILIGFSGGAQ